MITHIAPTLIVGDDDDNVRGSDDGNRDGERLGGGAIQGVRHLGHEVEGAPAVAVPLMTPPLLRVSPGGREPENRLQV